MISTPGGRTSRGSICPENSTFRLRALPRCSRGASGSLTLWIHPECSGTSANAATAQYRTDATGALVVAQNRRAGDKRSKGSLCFCANRKDDDEHRLPAAFTLRIHANVTLIDHAIGMLSADAAPRHCGGREHLHAPFAESNLGSLGCRSHQVGFATGSAIRKIHAKIVGQNFSERRTIIAQINFVPRPVQFPYRLLICRRAIVVHLASPFKPHLRWREQGVSLPAGWFLVYGTSLMILQLHESGLSTSKATATGKEKRRGPALPGLIKRTPLRRSTSGRWE